MITCVAAQGRIWRGLRADDVAADRSELVVSSPPAPPTYSPGGGRVVGAPERRRLGLRWQKLGGR